MRLIKLNRVKGTLFAAFRSNPISNGLLAGTGIFRLIPPVRQTRNSMNLPGGESDRILNGLVSWRAVSRSRLVICSIPDQARLAPVNRSLNEAIPIIKVIRPIPNIGAFPFR